MNYLQISKIAQIVLAVLITVLVLIQSKSGGFSSSLDGVGGFYRTRRGLEKLVFILTIVLGILFILNSLFIVRLG